jgi:hypothetical protein
MMMCDVRGESAACKMGMMFSKLASCSLSVGSVPVNLPERH